MGVNVRTSAAAKVKQDHLVAIVLISVFQLFWDSATVSNRT